MVDIADPTVALNTKDPNASDVVAPLTAFANMQLANSRSQEIGLAARQQGATFAARQGYLDLVNQGYAPEDAIVKSGLSAIDPVGAGQALTDVQQERTLGANRNYDPSNPASVAAAGPAAVGQAATALSTETGIQKDRATLMAQHGNAFLANPTVDNWNTQVQSAHDSGLISDLQAQQAWGHPDINIAKAWAAGGQTPTDYANTSGAATFNQGQAKAATDIQKTQPGETLSAPPAARNAMNGGWQPPGSGSSAQVAPIFTQAGQQYGVDPAYLARTAQLESGGNPNARNGSHEGLMQLGQPEQEKYGVTDPYNPVENVNGGAQLAADNQAYLTRYLGRAPTNAELYLAHQQGPAGAVALLSNPNARAGDVVGDRQVLANGGNPNGTAGQFAQMWLNKFNGSKTATGNFDISGFEALGGPGTMPTVGVEPGGAGVTAAPGAGALAPSAAPRVQVAAAKAPPPPPDLTGTSPMPAPGAPNGTPQGQPGGFSTVIPGLTVGQKAFQEKMGEQGATQVAAARDAYQTAGTAQQSLMQLSSDLSSLTAKDGTFNPYQPGPGAEERLGFAKAINTALASAGLPPMFDQDKIAASEASQKITGRLGFDLARTLGAREPGMIVQQAVKLNPSIENTPAGAKMLIASLNAGLQRQRDFYAFQNQYAQQNGSPQGAELAFDQSHPIYSYVQDAQNLSHIPQGAIDFLQKNATNPDYVSAFNQKYGAGLSRYYIGTQANQ